MPKATGRTISKRADGDHTHHTMKTILSILLGLNACIALLILVLSHQIP